MPTIVVVTGHASAAGYILLLSYDYILMRSDRGFLYMSKLDIKLMIPLWFVTVVKSKFDSLAGITPDNASPSLARCRYL